MKVLLLLHIAATLVMVGVIFVVQVVHYPLFSHVGAATYAAYQARHMRRITCVVLPTMTLELGTAVALAAWRPLGLPAWQAWSGLALVGLIWASTAALQGPLHRALVEGFDADSPSPRRHQLDSHGRVGPARRARAPHARPSAARPLTAELRVTVGV